MTNPVVPVYKIGAVVLRQRDGQAPEFFIMRTKPKRAGERAPWALPRGSRQYAQADAGGKLHYYDARDAAIAAQHADTLEPLTRALKRELYEEAGIPRSVLQCPDVRVQDMGTRLFQSRNKPAYDVHWFVVAVNAVAQSRMQHHPRDTVAVQWATLNTIEALAAAGDFSPGYVPVVKEVVAALEAGHRFAPVIWSAECV